MAKMSRGHEIDDKLFGGVFVDRARLFTVVSITTDTGWTGVGIAKRNPEDKFNFEAGRTLAAARALRDMADDLEHDARARMR